MKLFIILYLTSAFTSFIYADISDASKEKLNTSLDLKITYDSDPLEGLNRGIFQFNKAVDENVLHPIGTVYKKYTPAIAKISIRNFFFNLGDIPTLGNQLLQFKLVDSLNTLMRIIFNTTFGMGGIADVASEIGFKRNKEDFGQTLGYYGVPSGPYLVLPLAGPSSLRDAAGYPVDRKMSINLKQDIKERLAIMALRGIDISTSFADIAKTAYQGEDPYIIIRSSYLQNREFEINDGNINTDSLDF